VRGNSELGHSVRAREASEPRARLRLWPPASGRPNPLGAVGSLRRMSVQRLPPSRANATLADGTAFGTGTCCAGPRLPA
jgi:hypothetical protein